MSLTLDAWKFHIDQPKNLGLKETNSQQRGIDKQLLAELCRKTIAAFRNVQTEKALRDAFAEFKARFGIHSRSLPKLENQVNAVRKFDKKDPVNGLLGIRDAFIQLVQDASAAVSVA